ncbi:hypothetical protein ACH4S8_41925 [Streptomyces sp. NPDC021080]
MQESIRGTQDEEPVAFGEAEVTGQSEYIEIRLLDKIETIQNKQIDS